MICELLLPAAADDLVIQVGRKAFEVHIVIHKHKLQLSWSAQIWNTHTQIFNLTLLTISTSLWQRTDKVVFWPSGRKVSRLAAMESWLRRWSQQSCRGTWLSGLWSAVRFCRETQRCSRSGRDISWFIDTSRVSSSCRSPISEGFRQTWKSLSVSRSDHNHFKN